MDDAVNLVHAAWTSKLTCDSLESSVTWHHKSISWSLSKVKHLRQPLSSCREQMHVSHTRVLLTTAWLRYVLTYLDFNLDHWSSVLRVLQAIFWDSGLSIVQVPTDPTKWKLKKSNCQRAFEASKAKCDELTKYLGDKNMSVPDFSAHFYSKNPQVPVLPGDMAVHGQEHDFLLVIFFSPAPD